MTILDVAQSMKGRLRDGLSQTQSGTQPGESEVAFGTARGDSSDGFVTVMMDGAPQPGDPDYDPDDPDFYDNYTFTVPCDSVVSENDRVSYISTDGYGKAVSLEQTTRNIEAISVDTDTLKANIAVIGEATIGSADVAVLVAESATAAQLEAAKAKVAELEAQNVTARLVVSTDAVFDNVKADTADFTQLNAKVVYGSYAKFYEIDAESASIGMLQASTAVIANLDAEYAKIDAANIGSLTADSAWVDKILVQTGLLANDGTVFTLDAVQVNAANITAGTLDVQRFIVTDESTGEKYIVHFENGAPVPEKLNGNVIASQTIAADKLVANCITVDQITTQSLVGTGGWINLANGTFGYYNGDSFDSADSGISWDGTNLEVKAMTVNADSITFTSGVDVESSLNDLETQADTLSQTLDDQSDMIGQLNERVFETMPAYMSFSTETVGQTVRPMLVLGGGTDWEMSVELTNDQLRFVQTANDARAVSAYIGTSGLMIEKAEVVGDLFFGGWVWQERGNGHMTLRKARQQ